MPTFTSCESGSWSANHTWGDSSTECVTNGSFASDTGWTKSAGTVTIASGVLTFTAASAGANASQTPTGNQIIQSGRTYTAIFDVSGLSGSEAVKIGIGGTFGTSRTTDGTDITEDIVAGSDGTIKVQCNYSTSTFTVDNLRVTLKTEAIPANNDTVVIAAGHNVLMDSDTSGFADGINGLTINGGVTPGMLYFKNGTSGHVKMKDATVLGGTFSTNNGRLLANSSGTWGETTALAFADKAVIELVTTASLQGYYLDIALYCTQPTNLYVRTYGTMYTFTGGAAVNAATDTIDLGTTPPSANTMVKIVSRGGTLPAGLSEDDDYYVYNVSGNTCQLVGQSTFAATIIDIKDAGSGALALITGHTSTSTGVMNVLEDVTADTPWTTTSGHNRCYLTNSDLGSGDSDIQFTTLSGIASGTVTLAVNVNSTQRPGARVWLVSRNVSIRFASTSSTVTFVGGSSTLATAVFQCEIVATSGTRQYGRVGAPTHASAAWDFKGVIANVQYCLLNGNGTIMSGVAVGCTYVSGTGVTNNTYSGKISGCQYGVPATTLTYTSTSEFTYSDYVFYASSANISNSGYPIFAGKVLSCKALSYNVGGFRFTGLCSSCGYLVDDINYSYHGAYTALISGEVRCTLAVQNSGFMVRYSGLLVRSCKYFFQTVRQMRNTMDNVTVENIYQWTNGTAYSDFLDCLLSVRSDGVANKTLGWSNGGTMTHETSTVPSGKTYSHKLTFASATLRNVYEWEIQRPSTGNAISIVVHAKHDATSLGADARITWALVDRGADKDIDSAESYLDSWTAADSTDWQSDTLTYTPVDDRRLVLRVWATRASGVAYIYSEIPTAGAASTGGSYGY